MLIACTKKCIEENKLTLSTLSVQTDDFYTWHVKLFTIYGNQILLFMNNATRFPIFMHHIEREGFDHLEQRFELLLHQVIRSLLLPDAWAAAYCEKLQFEYVKVFDFSIMSSLNSLSHVNQFNITHGIHPFFEDVDASIYYARIPNMKHELQAMIQELQHRFACIIKYPDRHGAYAAQK